MTARDGHQIVVVIESLDQPIELPRLAERDCGGFQDSVMGTQ
jgi:hypothetical protein